MHNSKKNTTSPIKEMQLREMVSQQTEGLEEKLREKENGIYLGIDLSASSLHVGHLASLIILKHFQRSGHRTYLLLGGATSLIGDPSFKGQERPLIDKKTVCLFQESIQTQIKNLFREESNDKELLPLQLVNNYDWFQDLSTLDFLRDIGKYITINYLLSKEAIKKRLVSGISYTEFAYPLLQAYDFLFLYKNHNVTLQIGGSDQWGNITTGAELIRKHLGGEAEALTTPLITRSDGTKFGKTAIGTNIWLDPKKTSPYQFYQFWINRSDSEAKDLLKRLTLIPLDKISDLEKTHLCSPSSRILQQELAKYITTWIHGEDAYNKAVTTSAILFGEKSIEELKNEPKSQDELLELLLGLPLFNVNREQLTTESSVEDLLFETTEVKIFSSKKKARDLISGGGLSINKEKVSTLTQPISSLPIWMGGNAFLVQKGSKTHYLILLKD